MSLHALMSRGIAVSACLLFAGSAILFSKTRSAASTLQLIGSVGLMMVVLTHFAEAFDLISWMGWGLEDSAGHYFDLGGAVLGLTLFPIGYLTHALSQ